MKHLFLAAPAALLALSACNTQPTNITVDDHDDMGAALNAAPPVELPPAIKSTKAYRCKGNALVYVDFFDGDKQANLHEGTKAATPTVLKAEEAGKPFTAAGGYAVSGSGATIKVTTPKDGTRECNA